MRISNDRPLFVYGTLMKGLQLHNVALKGCTFLGEHRVEGLLLDLGWYPGYVSKKTLPDFASPVKGEVYSVPGEVLTHCDIIEGEGSLYRRTTIKLLGEEQYVWAYELMKLPRLWESKIIKSGDWRENIKEKEAKRTENQNSTV